MLRPYETKRLNILLYFDRVDEQMESLAINKASSGITRLLTLLFWERNPTSWTSERTVAFPVDSLAEVEVIKAPLELEEAIPDTDCEKTEFVTNILSEPEAVESPECNAGSAEPDTVEVAATEVVVRLIAEFEAVESPANHPELSGKKLWL